MIRKLLPKLRVIAWHLPALLLWASYPPQGECMDCLVALAPLLWIARNSPPRKSAWLWFTNGLMFWVTTLAWMPAIVKNGGPLALVLLGWFALGAYCALYFAAFGWLSSRFWAWAKDGAYWRRLVALVFAEPVLWAGLEIVRSRLFGGFSWNQLGVCAVNAGFGAPASLGGVYLASALVVLVNGTMASIVERMFVRAGGRGAAGGVPAFARSVETFLPLAIVWGFFRIAGTAAVDDSPRHALSVGLVQRNFPCVFDRERAQNEDPVQIYKELFGNISVFSPDLVVLSESALAEFGPIDSYRAGLFARFAFEQTGARGLLAGGGRASDGKEYNSAALFVPGGNPQIYDKVHLVPFGEYIPFDKTFTILQRLAPIGSCTPGTLRLLDFEGVKIGTAICFEDTDSAQMRRLAKMGAQLLVFITNDTWFAYSDEAEQHAWQCIARAVETGLPVVRVGNSGVTGIVYPDGKASWLRNAEGKNLVDARGTMFERILTGRGLDEDGAPRGLTAYCRLGDAPLFLAFVVFAAAAVFCRPGN